MQTAQCKYSKCERIYFQAPNNSDEYYYDTIKSVEIMENIILYQNGNNLEISVQFLKDVFNICEKKNIKEKRAIHFEFTERR